MLRIAVRASRNRCATITGALIALWLAVTFAYVGGSLMAGAFGSSGTGRFAAAAAMVSVDTEVILGHGDDPEHVDASAPPRLSADKVALVSSLPGVERAIGDITFPVGAWTAEGTRISAGQRGRGAGHGWSSTALAPFALSAGHEPHGSHEVVAERALGVRVGSTIRVSGPTGAESFRVVGLVVGDPSATAGSAESNLFFADAVAGSLSDRPGEVNAIGVLTAPGTAMSTLRHALEGTLGANIDVLTGHDKAVADAGDLHNTDRQTLIAIFATMSGLAAAVALVVVSGTFSLAIAQRRRETAVLRALGATPMQVRRMLSTEALVVALIAGGLGWVTGRPIAKWIARATVEHDLASPGFAPNQSWIVVASSIGLGVIVAQLAVAAAAWRAGRIRPSEALREAYIERQRPNLMRVISGAGCVAGGIAMSLVFSGKWTMAFGILETLLFTLGVGLLGRWLLGLVVVVLAVPMRLFGASAHLAGRNLMANHWRSAAIATPIVLMCALAGTQAVLQSSSQRHTDNVTAARVHADRIITGRDGSPLSSGTVEQVSGLAGVTGTSTVLSTGVFLMDDRMADYGEEWHAAGLRSTGRSSVLDLDVQQGSLRGVVGRSVAISTVAADYGDVRVGDTLTALLADLSPTKLRVAAIYQRATGLADIVLSGELAAAHAAARDVSTLFVSGNRRALRALNGLAAWQPGIKVSTRADYLAGLHAADQAQAWAVWLIIGLVALFAVLGLVNTTAMTLSERRSEFATVRLMGGSLTQSLRMIVYEMVPTMLVAVAVGAGVVWLSVAGLPRSVTGLPLVVPVHVVGPIMAGAVIAALATAVVTGGLAVRRAAAA